MLIQPKCHNWKDENGNPAGGTAHGPGLCISWQNGPLGRGENRIEPNGAFVESVIAAAIDRIEFYQESKFACEENETALQACRVAAKALDGRTTRREADLTEGTHAGS